jgi:hypothetical protein
MSHIARIQSRVQDLTAVAAACRRLELPEPTHGTARLYSGEVTGLMVQLPGWRFPVVIDTASGTIEFDNYGGEWGEHQHLDRFLQIYAVEKSRLEARQKGFPVSEQLLQDGSIRLQIIEGA